MRSYPYSLSGPPDVRSPARYLLWIAGQQKATLAAGILLGTVWMASQAVMPFVLGRAIDDGVIGADYPALLAWAGILLGLMVVQAVSDTATHRAGVSSWMQAAFRSVRLVGHTISRTGEALPSALSTGEVVSTAASDAFRLGEVYEVLTRLVGAAAAWLVVTALIWQTSPVLGVVVLTGVPVCCGLLLFVVRPLQARQREQREASGRMTAVGADTVAGLRVLRGIGGEHIFVDRYRARSAETRDSGIRVAHSLADLEASQVFVAGTFSVVFTWVGASLVLAGDITPGELVALYGFSIFLMTPIRAAADSVARFIRAHVGARKILAVLAVDPYVADSTTPVPAPPSGSALVDGRSGVVVEPGLLTAVVSKDPAEATDAVTRLGRFEDAVLEEATVRWGPADLRHVPLAAVRERIVVSEASPQLFSGPLRRQLDPHGRHDDGTILAALEAASALDILDGLDGGLDHAVTERGRGFSGGQRQRLVLARAYLTDAENLVLVEPTSAVDAHTEQRIASRLAAARRRDGRTTVVVTASPLVLRAVDRVVFLEDGRVAAQGSHQDLMTSTPAYRDVVIRSE
ncbi:multidrug ABC transporter permease [Arthrobacter pityocampae]|uniref:Multidrug ABC transporter permease n=1 Tax=Arthrobacter pityocampae TaxID=547334 RepID=A0A2S5J2P9_9MICC|nr:ABC transporter ATP-binding protein [Arthrobacter pityocampae]PPB51063.1 multidrug ABC transporter permease [Arthrobacter pityocampae]